MTAPSLSVHAPDDPAPPDPSEKPADRKKKPPVVTAVPPLLVGREDAAAAVGLSVATWDRLVAAGKTPAPVSLGGRVLFRVADLERWVGLGCPDRRAFDVLKSPTTARQASSERRGG